MSKEYPLICDDCGTKEFITNRKVYKIEISEIILDKTESKYAYTRGDFRQLQICEHCFANSDIDRLLERHDRVFK